MYVCMYLHNATINYNFYNLITISVSTMRVHVLLCVCLCVCVFLEACTSMLAFVITKSSAHCFADLSQLVVVFIVAKNNEVLN